MTATEMIIRRQRQEGWETIYGTVKHAVMHGDAAQSNEKDETDI